MTENAAYGQPLLNHRMFLLPLAQPLQFQGLEKGRGNLDELDIKCYLIGNREKSAFLKGKLIDQDTRYCADSAD